MDALLVKLGILAGLFGYIGLLGLVLLLASLIWLMIRVANFDSVVPGLLCVLVSIALAVGGLMLAPAPKTIEMEPMRPPWEAPLEALKEQAGRLKDIGPWARFFKDGDSPESAPEEGEAREGGLEAPLEDTGAKTVPGERNRIPNSENSA